MNPENKVHPIGQNERGEIRTRAELIERWRTARYEDVLRYPAGKSTDSQGNVFEYQKGARLIILGEEVMDSCQSPWAEATVDRAFDALRTSRNNQAIKDVKVLERGFGMGLVATRILQHLRITGGRYTAIELNEQVADHAETDWKNKQNDVSKTMAASPIGGSRRDAIGIGMEIIRGEAFEETSKLAEEGRKFDIIISDTYPLSDEEKSINDLLDIEQLIQCLAPDGVFAFFGYHTGSDGTLNTKQTNLVERHFETRITTSVPVSPPPDYKYFNPPNGQTVRRLPITICMNPINEVFNAT